MRGTFLRNKFANIEMQSLVCRQELTLGLRRLVMNCFMHSFKSCNHRHRLEWVQWETTDTCSIFYVSKNNLRSTVNIKCIMYISILFFCN